MLAKAINLCFKIMQSFPYNQWYFSKIWNEYKSNIYLIPVNIMSNLCLDFGRRRQRWPVKTVNDEKNRCHNKRNMFQNYLWISKYKTNDNIIHNLHEICRNYTHNTQFECCTDECCLKSQRYLDRGHALESNMGSCITIPLNWHYGL